MQHYQSIYGGFFLMLPIFVISLVVTIGKIYFAVKKFSSKNAEDSYRRTRTSSMYHERNTSNALRKNERSVSSKQDEIARLERKIEQLKKDTNK